MQRRAWCNRKAGREAPSTKKQAFRLSGLKALRIRIFFFTAFFLGHQVCQFLIFSCYIAEIVPSVGKQAKGTVFAAGGKIPEIAAAFFSQGIQGAIAEQAVEVIRIRALMAGEVFTVFVAEIRIFFPFPGFFHGKTPF